MLLCLNQGFPYRAVRPIPPVHTGPTADRYADRQLPGGSTKIGHRRSIEEEKGKKKKEEKKKKKKKRRRRRRSTSRHPSDDSAQGQAVAAGGFRPQERIQGD
ncbi:hypothetical protein B296_00041547, partial [Ensete ventricosum]